MTHRLLILGGTGFLGKEITRLALATGWEMLSLSRHSSPPADVTDLSSLQAIAQDFAPSHVIHCASASGFIAEDRLASYRAIYAGGAKHVARAFPKAHLLFTSSTSVYAQNDGSIVTETSDCQASAATTRALIEAENAILTSQGTVARLSGIYGHRYGGRSYLLKQLLGGTASIDGSGERFLNHIHHTDAARACLHLLKHNHRGIYNVSETRSMSQRESYESLCEHFNLPLPPRAESMIRKRGISNKRVDNTKLRTTGFHFLHPQFIYEAHSLARKL